MHGRQTIRDAVQALLTGLAGGRVVASRVHQYDTLPAIAIYTLTESSKPEVDPVGRPKRYSRNLDIVIELVNEAVNGADDAADDLAAQVEAIMGANVTLSGNVVDSRLDSTQQTINGAGQKPVVTTRLYYAVWYRTTGEDPETLITD